jgi:hypothetical protein
MERARHRLGAWHVALHLLRVEQSSDICLAVGVEPDRGCAIIDTEEFEIYGFKIWRFEKLAKFRDLI